MNDCRCGAYWRSHTRRDEEDAREALIEAISKWLEDSRHDKRRARETKRKCQ